MPREGGKSVADDLRKRYPSMQWLQGCELHRSKAAVRHEWLPLDRADDVAPAVIAALRGAAAAAADGAAAAQSIVFCRDVRSATAMHKELERVRLLPSLPPSLSFLCLCCNTRGA